MSEHLCHVCKKPFDDTLDKCPHCHFNRLINDEYQAQMPFLLHMHHDATCLRERLATDMLRNVACINGHHNRPDDCHCDTCHLPIMRYDDRCCFRSTWGASYSEKRNEILRDCIIVAAGCLLMGLIPGTNIIPLGRTVLLAIVCVCPFVAAAVSLRSSISLLSIGSICILYSFLTYKSRDAMLWLVGANKGDPYVGISISILFVSSLCLAAICLIGWLFFTLTQRTKADLKRQYVERIDVAERFIKIIAENAQEH